MKAWRIMKTRSRRKELVKSILKNPQVILRHPKIQVLTRTGNLYVEEKMKILWC